MLYDVGEGWCGLRDNNKFCECVMVVLKREREKTKKRGKRETGKFSRQSTKTTKTIDSFDSNDSLDRSKIDANKKKNVISTMTMVSS